MEMKTAAIRKESPMKIGMVLENNYTSDERVRREASYLADKGFRVFVLAVSYKKYPHWEKCDGVTVQRIDIIQFQIDKYRPLIPNCPIYYHLWKKPIDEFIKKNDLDALHIHDLPLMKLGIQIARRNNIPVIGDFHENFCAAIRLYAFANTFWGKLLISFKKWDQLQAFAVKNLDKVVVVADEAIDFFQHKYNRNRQDIYCVDNSIDIRQFIQNGINNSLDCQLKDKYTHKFVLGFIGNVLPNRGLQHLIEILPHFRNYPLKVIVIGKGKYIKILQQRLKIHQIEDLVDWYGWQPFKNVYTFIKHFNVGITRLERNAQNDYTTPNKVFQYMYLQKPVITADSLPMRRIIKATRSGFVFPSGDLTELKQAILRLYENPTLVKEMGAKGKKAVIDKYNWEATRKQLLKLYTDI